jgi:anti-sigma28 factor (negative regulator of flagellin synthesis)
VNPPNRKGNGNGKTPPREAGSARVTSDEERSGGNPVKKMAELRTAVNGGTYHVESRKVAGRIVNDAVKEVRKRLR